jgi:hypothetical protein
MKKFILASMFVLLFIECDSPRSRNTEQENIGTTVYITETGKKYHRADCQYLDESKIAISKSKAKAEGYTACKVCKP